MPIQSQESEMPESLMIPLDKSFPKMDKISVEGDDEKSSSICSDNSILDSTVRDLKSQLNVKKKNQNQAVDELDDLDGKIFSA